MAIEIKAPNPIDYTELEIPTTNFYIFLAGSIEMGVADEWQARVVQRYQNYKRVVFLNPRRDEWDPTWEQSIDNPQFKEQVNWELDAIGEADIVLFYFQPGTKSPITLLELGIVCGGVIEPVIICPDGFWRKGNVDIVAERCGTPVYTTFAEAYKTIDEMIAEHNE